MSERIFNIEPYHPVEIFGANEHNLDELKKHFPKLKIVVRGEMLKVLGESGEINHFSEKFDLILMHFDKFGKVNSHDIRQLMKEETNGNTDPAQYKSEDVLVFGREGMHIKARTRNQQKMVESIATNDLIMAIGPAGTGKTYTAVAMAVRALKNKEVRRIVLTRPAVEAGENLGFLPGDLRDKLDPYLQPLYDALRDMIPQQKLLTYFEDGTIEIAPLAFMRGRTLDHAFVILDEAQNATVSQLKMFLTRMGKTAKFVVTGDITQIDLPRNQKSGLVTSAKILEGIEGIEIIRLDASDVIRHPLVTRIIDAYEKNEENREESRENQRKS